MTLSAAQENVSASLADTATKTAEERSSAKPAASAAVTNPANAAAHATNSPVPQANAAASFTKTGDVGQADRVRFVERVQQAFQSMGAQGGTVRLKLSPPELGSMRLEISIHNGAITARAETETTAARNLLLDNLPMLRERLAQQDIKVQQFDVDVMDPSAGGMSDQASYSSGFFSGQSNSRGSQAVAAPVGDDAATAVTGASVSPGTGNQLNVIV
jgi:flagellar hook-length control protein FliK